MHTLNMTSWYIVLVRVVPCTVNYTCGLYIIWYNHDLMDIIWCVHSLNLINTITMDIIYTGTRNRCNSTCFSFTHSIDDRALKNNCSKICIFSESEY